MHYAYAASSARTGITNKYRGIRVKTVLAQIQRGEELIRKSMYMNFPLFTAWQHRELTHKIHKLYKTIPNIW